MAYTTIDDPTVYFQTVIYTGNGTAIGSGGLTVTFPGDTDLAPGMLWIKRYDTGGDPSYHMICDAVRGSQNRFYPNTGDAEDTNVTEAVNAFTSDGWNNGNSGTNNGSGLKHVAWCWKAGTTSGIGTSGQDITPSGYSIETTSKFGIYAYGGNGSADQQINHGLGVAPKFMINKIRSNGDQDWHVFHIGMSSAPETDYMYLNAQGAPVDRLESWQDTLPDTTDFTLGNSNDGNQSGQTYMIYAWGEVQGFSKFGSYTGNGNADGPMLHMGFSPAWIMCKKTSATGDSWTILDNKRDTYNVADSRVFADSNGNESTSTDVGDFLSNGFKIRTTAGTWNDSGGSYMYAAFAQSPFVNSSGVPTTGR